jgi:hypothetical protein
VSSLLNTVSGVVSLAVSALTYFWAADIMSWEPPPRPVTLSVSPSFLTKIEWRHSATFWLAFASIALAIGVGALVTAGRRRVA